MTFEAAVELVECLSTELHKLAELKFQNDTLPSTKLETQLVETSRNVDQMITELTEDFGSGSALDKIKETLELD